MKYIFLRGSDLAKLTGHNQYESKEKVINEILSRNGILDKYVPSSNIEEKLVQLTDENIVSLKEELLLPPEASLTQIESTITSSIMKNSYSPTMSEEVSKTTIDKQIEDKPILKSIGSGIKQDLRMRRGNIKEHSNLNKIQQKKNIHIGQRNSKMYSKELFINDTYAIIIRGKVDGISDGTIIETKNRTKYLFKVIRPYEQVQLECYMFLTGMNDALLTEHYDGDSYEMSYTHDEVFWSLCKERILTFIDEHIAIHLST